MMIRRLKLLLVCLLVSTLLVVLGFLSGDPGILGNTFILSTFIVAAPQLFLRYERYRALKEMEERFPDFLHDVIDSLRAGMPLHQAIQASGKIEYGKLSPEIRRMANQISWGMPLDRVLELFTQRVRESRRLTTAIAILRESYKTGGDIGSTLDAIASESIQLEEVDKERRSLLSRYGIIMYFICIVFIAIVVILNRFLVPVFEVPGIELGELGLANPCKHCLEGARSPECLVCGVYEGIAIHLLGAEPVPSKDGVRSCEMAGERSVCGISAYYGSLFFLLSLIQSLFCGLIIGQMVEGSLVAGIKHGLILIGMSFGTFSLLAGMGFIFPG
jgi:flagellar protein FlaJ